MRSIGGGLISTFVDREISTPPTPIIIIIIIIIIGDRGTCV